MTPIRFIQMIPLSLALLILTACAGVQPRTYDEGVWYAYATAEVVVTAASAAALDPATPPEVADAIKQALADSRQYFVELHDADLAVDEARAALAAGTGTQEKLEAALALLEAAQAKAKAPLDHVAETLGGAP